MPQVAKPITDTVVPIPRRIRWTRQQCEAIRESGVLTGAYELIDGAIISKTGQKPAHRMVVVLLQDILVALFGRLRVPSQATIERGRAADDYNEPEPDLAVTSEPNTAYADRHPGPDDLLLVVEVSDTTLEFDRTRKADLYARAGIGEYWVVDIMGRQVFVHRMPSEAGYTDVTVYAEDELITPIAAPQSPVRVADFLPPA